MLSGAYFSPTANANGWHNTDVAIAFSATDNLSGIDAVSPDIVVTTDGAASITVRTSTDGIAQGCADAARHTYFNCLLTVSQGPIIAQIWADAHEFDAYTPPLTLVQCRDNAMDLHNNAVGRELANIPCSSPPTLTSEQCCQRNVINALKTERLEMISGGALIPTGGCAVTITPP